MTANALAAEGRLPMRNRQYLRASVGPTAARNAILPICVGFIDRSIELTLGTGLLSSIGYMFRRGFIVDA